ncbi:MAG: response regulator [Gemmatimonadota bacterium]|nr:response regulator [Gemmatimonadota bacterium]
MTGSGVSSAVVATERGWFFDALAAHLEAGEFALRHVADADALVGAIREDTPDLVLVHDRLGGSELGETCRLLRSEGMPAHVAVVAVSSGGHPGSGPEIEALEAGAWAVLREPIEPALVGPRLRRLVHVGRLVREGGASSVESAGPGVYSFDELVRTLSSLEALADRQGARLTCAVLGPTHRGEGKTLERQRASTAEVCRAHVRRSDVCGWLGPGELVVVAFDTPVEGTRELVLRLNAIAAERAEVVAEGTPTLSAGIAEIFPGAKDEPEISSGPQAPERLAELGILAAAREALERARKAGGGIELAAVA